MVGTLDGTANTIIAIAQDFYSQLMVFLFGVVKVERIKVDFYPTDLMGEGKIEYYNRISVTVTLS